MAPVLLPIVPVAILLLAAGVVAMIRDDDRGARWLTAIGLAGAGLALALLGRRPGDSPVLASDAFTTTMGIVIVGMAATATAVGRHGLSRRFPLVVVLLLAATGLIAIGSPNLLVIAAALAVIWFGAALVAGSAADERGTAPVVRYVVGAGAAGLLALFGSALVVAATGAESVEAVRVRVATMSLDPHVVLLVGGALIGAGALFALVVMPLQMAAGDEVDVDGGIAVLLASATTKVVLVRLLLTVFDPVRDVWVPVVSALAGVLMIGCTLGAFAHVRLHRALTWLSVSFTGFVLAAVVPPVREGAEAAILLTVTWAAVIAGVVVAWELSGSRIVPRPLTGLGRAQPAVGLALTVGVLALAGLPLTFGFGGRWHLALAVMMGQRWDLAVAHGVATALAAIVTVRIAGRIWARPAEGSGRRPALSDARSVAALFVAAPLVVFAIWTSPLAAAVRRAAAALF